MYVNYMLLYLASGGGNGNPLQHSCLENPMDREEPVYGPWGRKESDLTEVTEYACMQVPGVC